jgi:hypothetical protein
MVDEMKLSNWVWLIGRKTSRAELVDYVMGRLVKRTPTVSRDNARFWVLNFD